MTITKKIASAYRILRDAKAASDPQPQMQIFEALAKISNSVGDSSIGLDRSLELPSITNCIASGSWKKINDEHSLEVKSTLFSDFNLRAYIPSEYNQAIVFLPGSITGAIDVMCDPKSDFFLKSFCERESIALFVWDWPLQGERKKDALYKNTQSHSILEREYSRILTLYGTSLWHEYLAELRFCLEEINKLIDDNAELTVVGWSQGAWFSYFSPLLGTPIDKVIAAGSCATFSDLVDFGATHVHGFFYYPCNAINSFDLDDVINRTASMGTKTNILFGDNDRGCFPSSLQCIKTTLEKNNKLQNFHSRILPSAGHVFTTEMKMNILKLITEQDYN